MKKKLSLLLAVVFIMTLAFGILPTAGAEQAPNHDADPPAGYHWECTDIDPTYETVPSCGKEEHESHGSDCYELKCTAAHTHSDECQGLTCDKYEHKHFKSSDGRNDCYKNNRLTCKKQEHTHGSSCYTTCNIPEHTHSGFDGDCYNFTCPITDLHTHSIEAGCYALIPAQHTCELVRDKGNLTLNVKYSSRGHNANGASVSFIDADGDSHTGTTNSKGKVTFTGVPTGTVTFGSIIYTHTSSKWPYTTTYAGTPESMVIEKGDNSGSVVLQEVDTYNHVDVRLAGSLTIDKQTNGVSDDGYPKDIDVTVSNVSGNYKIGTTEYPLNGFTIEGYELRKLGLTMLWPDSVTINCTLTDDDGNTYPFSYTFEGDEIEDANDECDDHSGFDFDIAAEDIVNTLTHTVTFKTVVGGTIDGGTIDIEHTGLLDGSPFPDEPTTVPYAGYEFDGWYDSTGTKVTSFPETVTADTEWTAKWTQLTYPVTYTYVSGTEGKTLPDAISTTSGDYAVSDTTKYPVGTTVNRNNPSSNKYDVVESGVTTGTWNLTWSADSVAMVSGGITFTGTWTYTPATKYKVTYSLTTTENPNYGTLPDEASYFAGETVSVATKLITSDTTKDGLQGTWTFNGWKDGDSTVGTTFTMPAEHVNLTGSWTFVEDGKYSVTYTINGDAPASCSPNVPDTSATYYPGTAVAFLGELTTTDTTKAGAKGFWTFYGWYTDDVTVIEGSFNMPGKAVEFTGYWTFTEYPSFTIEKVDRDGALITSSPAEFTLYNDDETHSLYGTYTTNGGTALVDGLAPGIYYLKETKAPTGYNGDSTEWMVIVSENSNQIELFTSNEVETSPFYIEVLDSQEKNVLDGGIMTVENTLIPTPPPYNPPPPVDTFDTAMLTITKTVSGDVADAPDSSFDFTVTFTPGGTNRWNVRGIEVPLGASGSDGTYTFSLKADQSITFRNVPVGTTYVVTETTVLADGWSAGTLTDASGSVGANGASATIDNVYTVQEVAGASDEADASDEGSAGDDDQQVAGDVDVLPQTGGISSSTLLGIFGLALIAIGGAALLIMKKKRAGDNKSK